jgi:thiamine-monophosphate kinase
MRMKDVGEKGFLGSLLPTLPTDPRLIGGFGHDAAEIELPGGTMNLVLKIDRAPRPLAVAHQWANHACWGRMAVTAACSDILAFGGSPMALMLALSLSSETPTETARFIINGAVDECKLNNVIYAGGDTKEGSEINVVASAVGLVPKHLSLRRAVAEPGDLIVCAGEIGGFAASYFLASSPEYVDDMVHSEAIRYLSYPRARWDEALEVNRQQLAKGGTDCTDGLYDVLRTFSNDEFKVLLHLDRLPFHPLTQLCEEKLGISKVNLSLAGGDWNIFYLVRADRRHKLFSLKSMGLSLWEVGRVLEGDCGVYAQGRDERVYSLTGPVNDHFRQNIETGRPFMEQVRLGQFLRAL